MGQPTLRTTAHQLLMRAISGGTSSRQIALASGIVPETLHRFKQGGGNLDMDTDAVQRLYEHLSGTKIVEAVHEG